jgi:hypothetical protein
MPRTKAKPVVKKEAYHYDISDVEAAYQIFKNPDEEKWEEIRQRIKDNDGYCPCRLERVPENRCMCQQFLNRDSEGWCKCRAYFKKARTKKAAAAYKSTEFALNEKKERELEKKMNAEEKKQKEQEE